AHGCGCPWQEACGPRARRNHTTRGFLYTIGPPVIPPSAREMPMSDMPALRATDPEIHDLVCAEERRQDEYIRLIPSENYASRAVMEATGSVLTNKYSEGYPGKRYYEGQDYID